LKDDFQPTSGDGSTDELKPITKRFVAADFMIREKTFNGFFKRDPVRGELIMVEAILKVSRRKPMPINHGAIVPTLPARGKVHRGARWWRAAWGSRLTESEKYKVQSKK
jgi:hypothetical protein